METSQNMRAGGDGLQPRCDMTSFVGMARSVRMLVMAASVACAACGGGDSGKGGTSGVAHWTVDDAAVANAPTWAVDSQPLSDTRSAEADSMFALDGVERVQLLS